MKRPSIQPGCVAEVNLKYLLLYCCLSDGHFLKWNALIINNEQLRECTRIVGLLDGWLAFFCFGVSIKIPETRMNVQ